MPDGDVIALARAVENACDIYKDSIEKVAKIGLAASEFILSQYNEENLRRDLASFYTPLVRD